ncbi:glycosyltransferase [soil metagenome]
MDAREKVTPRTYLFALTDGGGTVPPELGIARRLVDRGHRVTVLADPTMEQQVRSTGAVYRAWSPRVPDEFRDWELKNPLQMARATTEHMMTAPAPSQAADTIAAIDELKPDRVVTSSLGLGAMVGAEARGLEFDALVPNVYPLPAPGLPPFGAGLEPGRGPLGRLRDRLGAFATTRLINGYALGAVNDLRREYGLEAVTSIWAQVLRARRILVLTSSAFDFPAELPSSVHYVGPVLDDPSWATEQHWTPPAGDDPLVLVALSSTFQNQAECIQRIADALGSLPVRGLVTTGPFIDPAEITAPANVTVVASAPHSAAMREAAVVVTHWGHGTVVKALAAGVPLVVVPHGRDQGDNAARVTSRAAGVSVPRTAPPSRFAAAISDVLEHPSYTHAAQELGAQIAHDAETSPVVDLLER